MSFAAPFWLLGLIPWAALSLWMLTGRRPRTPVPFLDLWEGPVTPPKPKTSLRWPPLFVVLALASLLLAVIGAAKPRMAGAGGASVAVVIDRGITMSALRSGGELTRFSNLAGEVCGELLSALGHRRVELIFVPGGASRRTDLSDLPSISTEAPPTAWRTEGELATAVRAALDRGAGPVVVLTDQPIPIRDNRMLVIPPDRLPQNVSIVHVAARETPQPQVMVRVRNQSDRTQATLVVRSNGSPTSRPIALPPSGTEENFFCDAPPLGPVLAVELEVGDDLVFDNRAWLVRQRTWPVIEVRGAIPEALRRMIDVYRDVRPGGEGSVRVTVAGNLFGIPTDAPGVGVLTGVPRSSPPREQTVRVVDHPLTADVDWAAIAREAAATGMPGEGWRAIVSSGQRVYLAVREKPAPAVWVGFVSDVWPRTPEFVVFWTNIFDFLGQGGDEYVGGELAQIGNGWRAVPGKTFPPTTRSGGASDVPLPGVYRRDDGAVSAMNALDVTLPKPPKTDWRQALRRLAARDTGRGTDLTSAAVLGSLLLAVLSAAAWAPSRPRRRGVMREGTTALRP